MKLCTYSNMVHLQVAKTEFIWFVFIPARRQCARRQWRWCWDCIRSASHGPVASPAKRCLRSSRRKTRLYHRHLYKYWSKITTILTEVLWSGVSKKHQNNMLWANANWIWNHLFVFNGKVSVLKFGCYLICCWRTRKVGSKRIWPENCPNYETYLVPWHVRHLLKKFYDCVCFQRVPLKLN